MRSLLLTMSVVVAAAAVHAEEPKDKKKKAAPDGAVDAFFGSEPTTPKKSSLDALQDASRGVAATEKKGLQAKDAVVGDNAKITIHGAFAAEKIVIDKKLGCQPQRGLTKLSYFAFDEIPAEGVPMAVCITLSSSAGREMAMTISIVDPRKSRVAKAESIVDFRGRGTKVDHIVDFSAPFFKIAGTYQYVVEMDGKEIARLPIFDVRVE